MVDKVDQLDPMDGSSGVPYTNFSFTHRQLCLSQPFRNITKLSIAGALEHLASNLLLVLSVWKEQTEQLSHSDRGANAEEADLVLRQELVSCALWLVLAKLEDLSASAAEAEFLDAGVARASVFDAGADDLQSSFSRFLLADIAAHPNLQHICGKLFPSLPWLQSPASSSWSLLANFVAMYYCLPVSSSLTSPGAFRAALIQQEKGPESKFVQWLRPPFNSMSKQATGYKPVSLHRSWQWCD